MKPTARLAAIAAFTATAQCFVPTVHRNKFVPQTFSWNTTTSLIVFGDSYSYVQGTLGRTNYSFIGDNFNFSFTPETLFADRIVQNQTASASGGPVWPEYLTTCGLAPGLTNPQDCAVQLWDFAYAGANTVSNASFTPPHWNHTVSFERQIEQFTRYGSPALESIVSKTHALVAVWIGINDINDLRRFATDWRPLYKQAQEYQFQHVQTIYDLGYRNILFFNLPPLDRSPLPTVNATMVADYNALLAARADDFAAAHPAATVLQFDVNSVLNTVLDEADMYGFKNTTSVCPGAKQPDISTDPGKYGCGSGLSEYFWFDNGHLTTRVHKVFTEELRMWLGKQGKR